MSDTCASFATVDQLNNDLSPQVRAVTTSTDFFSYYRLNLYNRVCPFWDDGSGMCGNRACAVETLDNEEDIPEIWRAGELSKLQGPQARHPTRQQQRQKQRPLDGNLTDKVSESCVVEYDDDCDERDYCVPEDESDSVKGDYVSLLDNPEKFTGYSGQSAHMVWDSIYRENCFTAGLPGDDAAPFGKAQASSDLRSVLTANGDPTQFAVDDTCIEKRVFYRIISGMHASISTHLCYDYLDQKTGTWGPNLTCFEERLALHPDRISNLYFNYGLLVRAVAKLEHFLKGYTFCTGDVVQDRDTKDKVLRMASAAASAPPIFDESVMFANPQSSMELKDDFRSRFRNVSRLMDCVGCDKCRLWGKLQTAGYGTALKVLFEFDAADEFVLKRTELVALVNTLDRLGTSLSALQKFRAMVEGTVFEDGEAQQKTLKSSPASTKNERPSSPSLSEHNVHEDDDEDDFDAFEPPTAYKPTAHEPSLSETFHAEFDLVYRTTLYVFREWISLPGRIAAVLGYESKRLFWTWLGMTVEEGVSFEWAHPPGREEL